MKNSIDIIAQVIGIVAMVFIIAAFQFKKNKHLILAQGIGGLLFSINYFLVGSLPSAGFNVVSVLSSGLTITQKKHRHFWFGLICFGYLVITVLTYESLWTIILSLAQLAINYAFWYQDGKVIRKIRIFFTSPVWLINNIFVAFTIGGIICEIFSIVSAIVSFIRYRKSGFEA